jgi:DNA-binding GntR family transcriptional regulator
VIERLPRATFRSHIADQLRTAILRGEIVPGAPLVETALAERFEVSRAPLREALRQLTEEGWVVTVPYTGTRVIELTAQDVREIHSMRVTLEKFAFELVWPHRNETFGSSLRQRHARLLAAVDQGDDLASIDAELELHGLVYEASGHRLLLRQWAGLRGRLQLYWAAHHRANGSRGPRRDAHDDYLRLALGADLEAMHREIVHHMQRGAAQTQIALTTRPSALQPTVLQET